MANALEHGKARPDADRFMVSVDWDGVATSDLEFADTSAWFDRRGPWLCRIVKLWEAEDCFLCSVSPPARGTITMADQTACIFVFWLEAPMR